VGCYCRHLVDTGKPVTFLLRKQTLNLFFPANGRPFYPVFSPFLWSIKPFLTYCQKVR
jgi:hypothetical protein